MDENTNNPRSLPSGGGLALGIGALAIIGCCGLPLLLVLASGVALATLLGVSGGIVVGVALVVIAVTRTRARRRGCALRVPEQDAGLRARR